MTDQDGQLSDRESEILRLLATGASNKEIANELVISVNTVKVHLRNIYSKLEVSTRTEASMWAVHAGLLGTPQKVLTAEEQIETSNFVTQSDYQKKRPWWLAGVVLILIVFIAFLGIRWLQGRNSSLADTDPVVQMTEQDRWQTQLDIPLPRAEFAVAVVSDEICLIGGETESGLTTSVECFDTEKGDWRVAASLPQARADIKAAVIGSKIFVPGGRIENDEISDQLLVYDQLLDSWEQGSPLPVSLSAYALTAFEGRLYVFGGWNGSAYVNDVFEYDPSLDVWHEKTPLPTARGFAGAAVSGGKIHILGGFDSGSDLAVHEVYSPAQDVSGGSPWSTLAPLPEPRSRFGVVSVADILHLVGGQGESNNQQALKYFPTRDVWEPFTTPLDGIWTDLGVVPIGTFLQALGGRLDGAIINKNISYQAIYTVGIPILQSP